MPAIINLVSATSQVPSVNINEEFLIEYQLTNTGDELGLFIASVVFDNGLQLTGGVATVDFGGHSQTYVLRLTPGPSTPVGLSQGSVTIYADDGTTILGSLPVQVTVTSGSTGGGSNTALIVGGILVLGVGFLALRRPKSRR